LRLSVTCCYALAMNVAQIIESRGGAKALADALGKTPVAVRVWKSRNRIPRSAWPDLMAKFPDLTLDQLLASERG
jgi:hypothetical protein